MVSGALGGSILGHHLSFEPRCDLANHVAAEYFVHAATDISDGLVIDLASICRGSGVGAELEFNRIPIADAARMATGSASDPLQRRPV